MRGRKRRKERVPGRAAGLEQEFMFATCCCNQMGNDLRDPSTAQEPGGPLCPGSRCGRCPYIEQWQVI